MIKNRVINHSKNDHIHCFQMDIRLKCKVNFFTDRNVDHKITEFKCSSAVLLLTYGAQILYTNLDCF